MNTLTHPVAPEEIMALVDGELIAAEARRLEGHIERCAECAALRDEFREMSQSLAEWKVAPVSEEMERVVEARVVDAAVARKAARARAYTPLTIRNWRLWAIGGGGAVAGVLALALFVSSAARPSRMMAYLPPESDESALRPQAGAAESYGYANTASSPRQAGVAGMPNTQTPPAAMTQLARIQPGVVGGAIAPPPPSPTAPMIARTVSMTILVKNIEAARKELDGMLAQHQGYAAQLTVNTPENGARSFQSSLRVPAGELTGALQALRTLGRVQTETQSGEEVTQQHTDLVARLTNARETEDRLRAILQQRTGKMEDVLEVEEKISETRGEIEQMEAEQKALEHRVDFATVDLQLTEEYKAQLGGAPVSVGTQMRNAFVAGIEHAGDGLVGLVLFAEEYGPSLLLWGAILGVPAWLLWRRSRRRRTPGY